MVSANAMLVSGTWVVIVAWLRTAASDDPVGRRTTTALPVCPREDSPDAAPALVRMLQGARTHRRVRTRPAGSEP